MDRQHVLNLLRPRADSSQILRDVLNLLDKGAPVPEVLGWGYAKIREAMLELVQVTEAPKEFGPDVIPQRWAGAVDAELLISVSKKLGEMRERAKPYLGAWPDEPDKAGQQR